MIGALQLFDLVWVMTGGGPVNASSTMAIAMFKAGFRSHEFGYGSALAVILFLFCLVVALLYQRFVLPPRHRRRGHGVRRIGRWRPRHLARRTARHRSRRGVPFDRGG
jgi:raffinose/stachyose/melibiose transport system permease protein